MSNSGLIAVRALGRLGLYDRLVTPDFVSLQVATDFKLKSGCKKHDRQTIQTAGKLACEPQCEPI